MSKIKSINEQAPYYGDGYDFTEFTDMAKRAYQKIKKSKNPREVVIEAWFLIDLSIRGMIISAFNLKKHSTEDFDLRYDFLPKAFEECVSVLEKMVKHLPKVEDDVDNYRSRGWGFFWVYLSNQNKDLYEQFHKEQEEYLSKKLKVLYEKEMKEKEEFKGKPLIYFKKDPRKPIRVNSEWIKGVAGISEMWFKKVRRINKARNLAAHSMNEEKIFDIFGINGKDSLKKLKKEVYQTLYDVVGVDLKKYFRKEKAV